MKKASAGSGLGILSSRLTFFYKFIFPTLWIGGFAFTTLWVFRVHDATKDVDVRWLVLAALLLGSLGIYWSCMRLKWVALDGDNLVISNYGREVRVPLSSIDRFSSSLLMNPEIIWVHFRLPTPFGNRIIFMPPQRFFAFTRHPLAKRLNELIAQSRA